MILEYCIATLIAGHVRDPDLVVIVHTVGKALQWKILACRVCPANVTVDTTPSFLTLAALSLFTLSPLFTISKRVALYTAISQGSNNQSKVAYAASNSPFPPIPEGIYTVHRILNTLQSVRKSTAPAGN